MYCILKYIHMNDYKRMLVISVSSVQSLQLTDADPKTVELYFNPNCLLQLILDYICLEVGMEMDCEYDFCNEQGQMVGIRDYKPTVNGGAVFVEREVYFIMMIRRGSSTLNLEMTPLLDRSSKEYNLLMKCLNQSRRKSTSTTSKRSNSSKHSIPVSQSSSNNENTTARPRTSIISASARRSVKLQEAPSVEIEL